MSETAVIEQKRDKNANLVPHRFKKGEERARQSPGRPRSRELVQHLRLTYEESPTPANMNRLIKFMEKRCPNEIAHYLAGKPIDTVHNLTTTDPDVIADLLAGRYRKRDAEVAPPLEKPV
jgi:hypothetical protein